MALFDVVVNNADRKGGHLLERTGRPRASASTTACRLHAEPKLRTVLWGFAGEPVPADLRADLRSLRCRDRA